MVYQVGMEQRCVYVYLIYFCEYLTFLLKLVGT
jgi:hypothetical protein